MIVNEMTIDFQNHNLSFRETKIKPDDQIIVSNSVKTVKSQNNDGISETITQCTNFYANNNTVADDLSRDFDCKNHTDFLNRITIFHIENGHPRVTEIIQTLKYSESLTFKQIIIRAHRMG
ncbi:hypothetical protein M153_2560009376 [Pseudoloma neurophilia]|uniref:Transposable element n=1 Tax=Pseudoloma neurophilia TaxID=146866 RepID=A0A0R0LYQ5_9MICR|nr:hypothetical protein M153_2560009376 [Pseudoloma neurophilia]